MTRRVFFVVVLAAVVFAVAAGSALASLGDDVASGRQVAQRVDARSVSCSALADTDFEHLGEYVMQRMLGSSGAHAAIDVRMTAMMGDVYAERMHQLMGRRYAGCPAAGTTGEMMWSGMMAGGVASGAWGAMMGSRDFAWMRNGAWRHMSQADWQQLGTPWMGQGMMSRGDGWSVWAVLGVVLGGLALGGLATFAALRRPWRRPHAPGPAAT